MSGEIDDYELDKRFLRKDGRTIHTHLTVACTRNPDGGVREVQASLLDVSAARRATEDLRQTLEELQTTQRALLERERLSTIGILAAGVAHEINNPLMGILNYVQYARARAARAQGGRGHAQGRARPEAHWTHRWRHARLFPPAPGSRVPPEPGDPSPRPST